MKLLCILMVVGIVCFSQRAYSQEERIIFPDRNITVKDALDQIQEQTKYMVSMNHENFSLSRKVAFSHNNLTLADAMNQLTYRTGKSYLIQGRYIVIYTVAKPSTRNQDVPPPAPKIELAEEQVIIPPVDVDSLTRALNERKVEFPAEIPPAPAFNNDAYYMARDNKQGASTTPHYTQSMPKWALRTNLLYAAATLTPNLGVEIGLNKKSTLLASTSYNGWKPKDENNVKLNHWIAEVEYRRWTCEVFNGHFFGVHGFYGNYNIAGKKVPFVFESNADKYRYDGNVMGLGVSYGYQFMLGKKWNLEMNVGVGAGRLNYDKFECPRCGDVLENDVQKWFVAPTKLGISLVYIIK